MIDISHQRRNDETIPAFPFFDNSETGKILDILIWPDPRLHQQSVPVTDFNISQLIADMITTMNKYDGIGLSAPQVNVFQEVIVLQIPSDNPVYFINPTIIEASEDTFECNEGCLSIPGYYETRHRSNTINITTHLLTGEKINLTLNGLYSFALQHEIDHLNGQLFIDGLSQLKQDRIKKKIKKTLRQRHGNDFSI